jgi:signal transduction histidine kinase
MHLNQSYIIRLRTFFVLFFFFINSLGIYSQSETLKIYIEEKLQLIEENLETKQYDLALNKIEELEKYSNYVKNDRNRLNLNFVKAQALLGHKEQENAINLLLKGLDELKSKPELADLKIKFSTYLGIIFKTARDYGKSRFYHKKALKDAEFLSDTISILKSYIDIGTTYYNEENLDSALIYFNNVIEYPISDLTAQSISDAYNNLNVIAIELSDLSLAEEYGQKSLKIKKEQKDTIGTAIALMNLSNVLYLKGEYLKVRMNYLIAYEEVKNLKNKKAISLKEDVLYNLAFVNEELKDYKNAFKYLEQATSLTDSLSKASKAQQITEIEAKFNVAKKAQELKEAESNAFRAQVFFYGLALAFLAFIVFGYIFYRNYRLNQRSKLEQLENETQTKIINATIDAKEKERKSIAEILHDSVSALLSSANLHLQASKAQLKKDAPQEISKAQIIVNEASVKIRDLSHELISSVLLKFGLAFAVHDMCQKYSNSEITLHSDDNGIKRYDQDFEIKIHNIIEELVNNILKHSKASNATIMMAHREKDMLSIRISDDGIGFDVKKAKYKDGLGLSHIGARVKVMKGVFNIISSSENGTSIFILVPIQHKKVA